MKLTFQIDEYQYLTARDQRKKAATTNEQLQLHKLFLQKNSN